MARFFLNILNGTGLIEDMEGLELPNLQMARTHAIEGVRSLLSEEVRHGRLDMNGSIEILDAERKYLLSIPFSDALAISIGRAPA